jgi:hypothetical protein
VYYCILFYMIEYYCYRGGFVNQGCFTNTNTLLYIIAY